MPKKKKPSRKQPVPEAQVMARVRHGGAAGQDLAAAASDLGKRAKGKRKNFSPEDRQRRADLMRQTCQPKRHPHPKQEELNQCLGVTL